MNTQILHIEHKLVKNHNWWKANQLAIYKATCSVAEELNLAKLVAGWKI